MKNIAVITGGYSGEAEISHQSAEVVIRHLDKSKYRAWKVIITREKWVLVEDNKEFPIDKNDFSCTTRRKITFDCAFIALHGSPGEDGKLQGYLDMLGMPYTTGGVLNTALTFNKSVCNGYLKQQGILSAKSLLLLRGEEVQSDEILSALKLPVFVKPNKGGSSLGISRVNESGQLFPAIEKAFKEDDEIIIEEFIKGTEITCGVSQQKGKIQALAITEIVSKNEFFDYHAKYHDTRTQEITPARIPGASYNECLRLSEHIYKLLRCKGTVRMDYFLSDGKLYLIEVNTVPGLTEKSLLPQQAAHAEISLGELFSWSIIQACG